MNRRLAQLMISLISFKKVMIPPFNTFDRFPLESEMVPFRAVLNVPSPETHLPKVTASR
jgi:hypothetical protein